MLRFLLSCSWLPWFFYLSAESLQRQYFKALSSSHQNLLKAFICKKFHLVQLYKYKVKIYPQDFSNLTGSQNENQLFRKTQRKISRTSLPDSFRFIFYNYSLFCKIMDENFHFLSLGLLIHLQLTATWRYGQLNKNNYKFYNY